MQVRVTGSYPLKTYKTPVGGDELDETLEESAPLVACRTRVTKRHRHFVSTPDVCMWFLRSSHVSDVLNALGSEVNTGDTKCLKK